MKMLRNILLSTSLLVSVAVSAGAEDVDWVAKSNENAQVLLRVMAELGPEGAGSLGIDGLDDKIFDLEPEIYERARKMVQGAIDELKVRLETETDRLVKQDLEILIKASEDFMHSNKLQRDNMLPYFNMPQTIFFGTRALIDPQVDASRYPAAVVRLEKYAGLMEDRKPITELAKDRTRERFEVEGLAGPYRAEIEQDLERAPQFIEGIKKLFEETDLEGWQEPYDVLAGQLEEYTEWVKAELLPRARDDFRLPEAMYQDALKQWGVEASPQELIQAATQGYMDIRNEMEALAPLVAKERGWENSDYREVIRRLKEEEIPGDELLDYYRSRLTDIEKIIAENKLVTLPDRDAGIRMGTEAETAAQPAPHLDTPRLIGNTGEYPYFVLPLLKKNEDGTWEQNDDTFKAGTWTLTAHEARPGHELQFSAMIEGGVSIVRAVFAFNSANVEGWALYAEAITKPYLPLDAQLISLQARQMRAARMFLDPMLNLGRITPEEAKRVLMEDVVLDEATAQNEVERYTYRIPGQATAYYYGYRTLQSLRTQTELALSDKFDQQEFHDFILAQGLLPPDILKKAVFKDFVPIVSAANVASN